MTATVNTGLIVRAGPGSSYDRIGSLAQGSSASIICQSRGEAVTLPSGTTSSLWDQLEDGGWVSDALVTHASASIPTC